MTVSGTQFEVDPELVVPDPSKTLANGALVPWAGGRSRWFDRMLEAVADENGFSVKTRWDKLRKADQKVVLYGSGAKKVQLKYRNRQGRSRSFVTALRGRHPLAPAPSFGVGVRRHAGLDRVLHARGPLLGLRRGPAQARVAGRHHRRAQHLRALQLSPSPPPRPGSTPWS